MRLKRLTTDDKQFLRRVQRMVDAGYRWREIAEREQLPVSTAQGRYTRLLARKLQWEQQTAAAAAA
jgi:DNA-binding NarL/FixJ family response regulator